MLETLQTNLNKRDKFQSKKTTPSSSFAVSDGNSTFLTLKSRFISRKQDFYGF